jgi:hypothetical protein
MSHAACLSVGTPRELVAQARAPTLAAPFLRRTGTRDHDSSTKGALS